jgi:tripartite-type tricarboxylate transporter receptor subunit TctC
MIGSRLALSVLGALAFTIATTPAALAQSYPDRPIKLVVPFPAGGATDTAGRLVAQALQSKLAQTVIIENQGGAGGTIGARTVAMAAPDGYTLLMVAATNTFGTMPFLYKLGFNPLQAFTPVATVVVDKNVMVLSPPVPARTVQEFVAYAKANPGKLNYGSAIGIAPHFIVELFKLKTGTDIVHVPYRGGAPMITDLLAGQFQMTVNGKSVLMPHIQAGKLRPVAVTAAERWPELPDVPTLTEVGYLDAPYDTLFGVVAPTGTPQPIIEKLNAAISEGLKSPQIRASLDKLGIEPKITTPQEFTAIVAEEAPRWAEIVRVTGIKIAE